MQRPEAVGTVVVSCTWTWQGLCSMAHIFLHAGLLSSVMQEHKKPFTRPLQQADHKACLYELATASACSAWALDGQLSRPANRMRAQLMSSVQLESCKGASGAPDLDPCSQSCRTKRHLQFSPQSLVR